MFQDFFNFLFSPQGFMPHGFCFLWQPTILWLTVVSDIIIFLSYLSIPFALAYFSYKRQDLKNKNLLILFTVFIFACGATHLLAAINIWLPLYGLTSVIKLITALVSLLTAILLWPLIPVALAIPSPQQLEKANQELKELNASLDQQVNDRTLELQKIKNDLQNAISLSPSVIYRLSPTDNLSSPFKAHFISEKITEMTGFEPDDWYKNETLWIDHLHPDYIDSAMENMLLLIAQGFLTHEYLFKKKDGSYCWIKDELIVEYDEKNQIKEIFGSWSDISLYKETEADLRIAAATFESMQSIIITDSKNNIVRANKAFTEMTGFSVESVLGKNPNILKSGRQPSEFYQQMWQGLLGTDSYQGEFWNRKKTGEIFPVIQSITAVRNQKNEITHFVSVSSDISDQKAKEMEIKSLAYYDPLTQLPNRTLLTDRFVQALAHSKREKKLLAVCFLDLDNFKPVNDLYGHEIGDKLLIEVAGRIKVMIRDEDTVSRQGGDEFVLLLGNIDVHFQYEKMLERIIESLAQPYIIEKKTLSITVSIGVTIYPNDSAELDALMRHADQAMYQAKLAGRNRYYLFNTELDQKTIQKSIQLQEIQQALSNNELCLYYQPKVNMKTGEVFGVEALIRWKHPEKGLIPPIKFLPIIENTELEPLIGHWVINEAIKQLSFWKSQGIKLEMSINISSSYLQQSPFISDLQAILALYPSVDSKYVQLEILESSALGDIQSISRTIGICMNDLGVNIALDDFGTDYSSLTHLKNLAAKTIKIDLSFIRDMLDDPDDYAIIDGIIGLSNAFNREVIAEGIETLEHGQMLLVMGCHKAQGYFISRPLPADELPTWLSNYRVNEEWKNIGNKVFTSKEVKIQLLKLSLKRWLNYFEKNIQALPEDIDHWPILQKEQCHCGLFIKRSREESLFEESLLNKLNGAHDLIHHKADELFNKYQNGEISIARNGLKDLHIAVDQMLAHVEVM